MAKKSFKSGFDSLFGDALDSNIKEKEAVRSKNTQKTKQKKSKLAANLDAFLQDAIEESIQEQAKEVKRGKAKRTKSKSKRAKPKFGLDSLIRQTVETSKVEAVVDGEVKRVTFFFDKTKIDRLKQIARDEKAYMKDIISELVSQYIEKYEAKS